MAELDNDAYRRYLDGEESAFAELIAQFRAPITFFIRRYVRNPETAEDLAADVFMDLVVHPHRYRFDTSLKTYLLIVARSRALDYLRREKRHPILPLEDVDDMLAEDRSLEETVLLRDRSRMLHEAIAKLPKEQQIAVHLVYFEDRSYADTARIMKKSVKQVDNLLYRAKLTLKDIIGEGGAIG